MTGNRHSTQMIGVVGGVGPYAGLDLVRKIFDQTRAAGDRDHLPVSLLSLPGKIIDRTAFLLGQTHVNPALAIAEVVNMLHEQGATVVGIPCNTAHAPAIFDEVLRRLPEGVTLIHMIQETIGYIRTRYPSVARVGILSTTGTRASNVYPDALSRHGLLGLQVLPETQRDLIQPAIYDERYGIKAQSNPVTTRARTSLHGGVEALREQGAEAVILGCTEIPLALTESEIGGMPLVDPTRILARALIQAFAPEALKPL